ncbi:hypothetical protein WL17_28705 [Burkholderia ubonensis]|nr:hypothetical protein WL17_28705 [Burkholderia ubonensis]
MTNESLAADLRHFFRNEEGFSLQFEKLPFVKHETLALRWDKWLVRVFYEEGARVVQDSEEISRVVGAAAPPGLARIGRRIRIVFRDYDDDTYTNQVAFMMDFLREIPGSILFDPQQRDLINFT